MPITPENRARYPKDWKALSLAARERAEWRCQHPGCGARQYDVGFWQLQGGTWQWNAIESGFLDCRTARLVAADMQWMCEGNTAAEGSRVVVIVLTVAHLDHQPENCDPDNLAAMCQRHHLAYDQLHHRAHAQATRRARAGTLELF